MQDASQQPTPKFIFAAPGQKILPAAQAIVDAFVTQGSSGLMGVLNETDANVAMEILRAAMKEVAGTSAKTEAPASAPQPSTPPAIVAQAAPTLATTPARTTETSKGLGERTQLPAATTVATVESAPARDVSIEKFLAVFAQKDLSRTEVTQKLDISSPTYMRWCNWCVEECHLSNPRKDPATVVLFKAIEKNGGAKKFISSHKVALARVDARISKTPVKDYSTFKRFEDNLVEFLGYAAGGDCSAEEIAKTIGVSYTTLYLWSKKVATLCELPVNPSEKSYGSLVGHIAKAGGYEKFVERYGAKLGIAPKAPAMETAGTTEPSTPEASTGTIVTETIPTATPVEPAAAKTVATSPLQPPMVADRAMPKAPAKTPVITEKPGKKLTTLAGTVNTPTPPAPQKIYEIPTLFVCFLTHKNWSQAEIATLWRITKKSADTYVEFLGKELGIKTRDNNINHLRADVTAELVKRGALPAQPHRLVPANFDIAYNQINREDLPALPHVDNLPLISKERRKALGGKSLLAAATDLASCLSQRPGHPTTR